MISQSPSLNGLSPEIVLALKDLGYEDLTEVQQRVIPLVMAGQDCIVSSQTGSGKTAAFSIPVCEKIDLLQRLPQVLVLTPTRELAVQIKQDIANIGRFKKVRCAAIFGKQSMSLQRNELRQRVHVIIGTPGRTLDHLQQGSLDLAQVKVLILDEADKMLDMGFIDQVDSIIKQTPVDRTTLVFSATLPKAVQTLCGQYMRNPLRIEVTALNPATEKILQSHYVVPENNKTGLLFQLLYLKQPERCIVFCNSRERVDTLAAAFKQTAFRFDSLHGGMEQRQRLCALQDFKRGLFSILIATDVSARGIHVDHVGLVVNMDLPLEPDSYIHRIGRTGRLENSGTAITFITPLEQGDLEALESYLQYKIPRHEPPENATVEQAKQQFAGNDRDPVLHPSAGARLNRDIARIRINAGRKEKIRPGDILGAITAIPGISAADTGIIDIQDTCSYVEILGGKGDLVFKSLTAAKIKGKVRTLRRVGFPDSI
jgi:superfamily II DNA/RNA helicase